MATPHRWAARAFVIALHAALLVAALLHRPPGPAPARERHATSVRLIAPPRQPLPPPDANRLAARRLPAAPAPNLTLVPPRDDTDTAAPTTPSTQAPSPAPAALPPAEPPRITLKLTLPPGYAASSAAARNPALSDPRSNTARTTLEDRIADATGGAGAWVEEPKDNHSQVVGALGDRRTVLRKGTTCVELHRSRIADADPFNASVAPRTVPMAGRAYPCK